jgi:hypothetical protein
MLSGFGCYLKYLAIKSHFSQEKYDYFKYNGKVKATEQSFIKRNDRYFFERLSKRLKREEDIEMFFVANFFYNSNFWIGESDLDTSYNLLNKKISGIQYLFKMEALQLFDIEQDFDVLFTCQGDYPILLKEYCSGAISAETIIILNDILHIFKTWSKNISDTLVWPEKKFQLEKYAPFLLKYIEYQPKEYKNILRKIFVKEKEKC